MNGLLKHLLLPVLSAWVLVDDDERALLEMLMATHARHDHGRIKKLVTEWITTAKHTKTGCLYREMVYQPILELVA